MITPSKIPDAWDMRFCSATPSWPHPSTSRWCTGQIQDATNPHKNWQKRHLVGYMGGRQRQCKCVKFEFTTSRRVIPILMPKWALLFYLALKLWTMTQAIINSVGPSITVSILHGAVHHWKTEPQQCLASLHLLLDLLDWYKTCPIYEMFTNIQKELWGSSKNHTNCLVLHCIGTASVLSCGLEAKQLENSSSGFSAVAGLLI